MKELYYIIAFGIFCLPGLIGGAMCLVLFVKNKIEEQEQIKAKALE